MDRGLSPQLRPNLPLEAGKYGESETISSSTSRVSSSVTKRDYRFFFLSGEENERSARNRVNT